MTTQAIYKRALDARVAWGLEKRFPGQGFAKDAKEHARIGGYDAEDSMIPFLVAEVPELAAEWEAGIADRNADLDAYYTCVAA